MDCEIQQISFPMREAWPDFFQSFAKVLAAPGKYLMHKRFSWHGAPQYSPEFKGIKTDELVVLARGEPQYSPEFKGIKTCVERTDDLDIAPQYSPEFKGIKTA